MVDIRKIVEEQIFRTLERGAPICDLLNDADINTIKSSNVIEQAIKQISPKDVSQIRWLEIVLDRQKINLDEIRTIRKNIGCK